MSSEAIKAAAKWADAKAESAKPIVRGPEKPTDERRARGDWVEPKGIAKHTNPMVDLMPDMIGALLQSGQITSAQEQAARDFQGLYAAYLADLGLSGYRSCLADSAGGFDSGEGDEASVMAYNAMRERIGRVKTALLAHETSRMAHEKPVNLPALRNALDVFIGLDDEADV